MPTIETLIKNGADVVALGPPSLKKFIQMYEINFISYESVPDYDWANSTQIDSRSLGPVDGREWFIQLTQAEFADAAAAIMRFKPDVVLVDSFFLGGGLAAERFEVPWATYVHYMFDERATTDNMYRIWWEQPGEDEFKTYIHWWNALRKRQGLGPDSRPKDEALWYRMSPYLTLLLTHPELRRTGRPLPSYVTRVHLHPWSENSSVPTLMAWPKVIRKKPRVMVSNSSAWQEDLDLVQATINGLKAVSVEIVATISTDHNRQIECSDNATILGYYPHDALLPNVDAVIATAGAGVVGKALWFGKPVIASPFSRDQYFVTDALVDCGLGLSVKGPPTPAGIEAAVSEIISNYVIKDRVQSIAGPRSGYPDAAEVCQLIMRLSARDI